MPPSAQGSQKYKLVAFSINLHYFLCTKTKFKGVVGAWLMVQILNFSYPNFLLIQTLKFLE